MARESRYGRRVIGVARVSEISTARRRSPAPKNRRVAPPTVRPYHRGASFLFRLPLLITRVPVTLERSLTAALYRQRAVQHTRDYSFARTSTRRHVAPSRPNSARVSPQPSSSSPVARLQHRSARSKSNGSPRAFSYVSGNVQIPLDKCPQRRAPTHDDDTFRSFVRPANTV